MKRYRLMIHASALAGLTLLIILQLASVMNGNFPGGAVRARLRSDDAHAHVQTDARPARGPSVAETLPPPRREWYVAPDGRPSGKGALDSPWDLQTALGGGPARGGVGPGDTVWLRGGRYTGVFQSTLAGTAEEPIIVRQYPGERAILDSASVSSSKQPALKVKGSWVWFWGFEITNSHPDRGRTNPYTKNVEPWRPSGADVYAESVKFINMVFHDNGHGIWDKKSMTEVYGSIFYYNGNNKREHAMYVGNSHGTKFIVDNIVFDQAGYGILCHSDSPSSSQKGLHIEGNVSFNNGIITRDDQVTGNIQVSGVEGVPAERVVLKSNYVYNPPGNAASKNNGIRLGYEDTGNKDAKLLDNYIVSDTPLRIWWWQGVELQGNTIYSQGESAELRIAPGAGTSAYRWDSNTYLGGRKGGPSFTVDGRTYSFASWQEATGFDGRSRVVQNASLRPSGVAAFVRPNKYEPGRANIIIYNWDHRPRVTVDIGSVLPAGASYAVLDAQNLFGGPVACGTYDGAPIELPMNLTRVAEPVGGVERTPSHTAPEFAVFVLRQDAHRQCK